MRLGRNFRQRQPVSQRTPIQRAIALLRRFGTTSDLRINAVSDNTVTSTGAVTIADGGGVEVLDTKIWRIV